MDNTTIVAMASTTVIAFLFGKAGVFQKILDFVLGQKKHKEMSIEETIKKKDEQIKELSELAEHFKNTCVDLRLELVQTNTHIVTLLAYLETFMPDGVHPFIAEMAKEIRKHQQQSEKK
jgi:uncharacterized membrane protein